MIVRTKHVALLATILNAFLVLMSASNALAQGANPSEMNTNDKEDFVYNSLKESETLIQNKKYVEARRKLKDAANLDPTTNSGNLHSMLGFVDQQLGDLEEAIAENQTAIQFDPKFTDLTWNIALAYKDLGNYDTAREWAQKYLSSNPSDPKRVQDAQGLIKKLGEQAGLNGTQSIRSPDYLDALVTQHGAGRWPRQSFPLKIYIEKSDDVPGVPANSIAMLGNAFDAWNKASGGALPTQLVSNRKQADITIQWTNKPDKVSAHDGVHMEQGITRVRQALMPGAQIGTIRSAEILLLTVSRQTGETVPDDDMKGVCLHEIGHALGLGGHSANSADTMYFSVSARQLPALSRRDKTTIARLYTSAPTGVQQAYYGMNNNRGLVPPFSQPAQSAFIPYQPNQNQSPTYTNNQPNSFGGNASGPFMQNTQYSNPYPQYGQAPNGYPQNAYPQSGYAQPGYPSGAQPQYAAPQNSAPRNTYPQQAYPPQSNQPAPVPAWLQNPYQQR